MGLKGIVAIAMMIWPDLANGYGQKDTKEDVVKNFQVHSKSFCFERVKTLLFWQELYEEGREAYLENNYGDCVKLFEAALRDYKHYTQVLVRNLVAWCPRHKSLCRWSASQNARHP